MSVRGFFKTSLTIIYLDVVTSDSSLYDQILPTFDNSDELAVVVHADAQTTWRALLDVDLLEVGRSHRFAGVLGAIRVLPQLAQGLIHGELPDEMPETMRLGELGGETTGDGEWVTLGVREGSEIAFGLVGKFWKPVIEYRAVTSDEFAGFDEPGIAKTIYAFKLTPQPNGDTLLTSVMRTATTDEHSRKWFRRYWTFGVGSGAHILVNGVLDIAREQAESAN